MVHTLHGLGINCSSGQLDWGKLSWYQKNVLRLGKAFGIASIHGAMLHISDKKNGWSGFDTSIGEYGTDYNTRAAIAAVGLGANKPEDAVYRVHALKGGRRYTLRLEAHQMPPTNAFWSITAYDKKGYLIPNKLNRYNRGSDTGLTTAKDGSITIYLQPEEPEDSAMVNNWLPTPEKEDIDLTARNYYPGEAALNGTWFWPKIEAATAMPSVFI
eukprot:TRINITY_DN29871_c0_g2_i2.p1 TRINITY_DN29871_c0_g2~~TRINITY_DN29871_c0_g2_i2.p1  ORF type:complete len:214 (+),score=49.39 TRINITY_DN29871_c0_g2_i2:639-1280(+)